MLNQNLVLDSDLLVLACEITGMHQIWTVARGEFWYSDARVS